MYSFDRTPTGLYGVFVQTTKLHTFIQKLYFPVSENSENRLRILFHCGGGGGHSIAIWWKIVVMHLHVQDICDVRGTIPVTSSAQPALLYLAITNHEGVLCFKKWALSFIDRANISGSNLPSRRLPIG